MAVRTNKLLGVVADWIRYWTWMHQVVGSNPGYGQGLIKDREIKN